MARWIEEYVGQASNAQLTASSSEFFAVDAADKQNRRKYGSMNSLLISYTGTEVITVELDGEIFARFSNATFSLKPEDGTFFNILKITNTDSASTIAAAQIRVRWARSRALYG